jgi:transcriptional regulator with XRE-family HTH domain
METISNIDELEARLGENLKTLRLQKNLDRKSLCARAGISMNALRHLENGAGANVRTLIRVARALDREDWLAAIAPTISINPLYVGRSARQRQRARAKKVRETHGTREKVKN